MVDGPLVKFNVHSRLSWPVGHPNAVGEGESLGTLPLWACAQDPRKGW